MVGTATSRRGAYARDRTGILAPSRAAIAAAKRFLLAQWQDRAAEYGRAPVSTLQNACKFSSLFAWMVFGGRLEGNADHQWVRLAGGQLLDLSDYAGYRFYPSGVAYGPDPAFWLNPEHRRSLDACAERVNAWVATFIARA